MFQTLRSRLLLSHMLPLLLIIPLIGIVLVLVMENRIVLPSLAEELEEDARLLAEIAGRQTDIWKDPTEASRFLQSDQAAIQSRIALFTPEGELLTGSSTGVEPVPLPNPTELASVRQGQTVTHIEFSKERRTEIIRVLAPVYDPQGQLIGIIRMAYPYARAAGILGKIRSLILEILLLGLLMGGALGLALAIRLGGLMQKITGAVNELAWGQRAVIVPEKGPVEVRQLAQSVNSLAQRLQDLQVARKRLIANLVHEIGRPLGAMRSGVLALQHGASDDPALYKDLLEGMDEEMARLQFLLEELAHMYEQVLGSLELELKPVDLKEGLAKMLHPWAAAAREKDLDWTIDLKDDLPVIQADPVRLAQVVGNLVSNAIKFTPAGGRVQISTGRDRGRVWIRVCDSGPGIPEEDQEHIFIPFYRGGQGNRFPQGMGLGLSIARDLTEAHRGELVLDSAPGKGACFTIYLPLEIPPPFKVPIR